MTTIRGTSGNDTITPQFVSPDVVGGMPTDHADSLSGGDGDDTLNGGAGNDTINGGSGIDWADYLDAPQGVVVTLAVGKALQDGFGNVDKLIGIENLRGSELYNDLLTGNADANELRGLGGNDTLDGGGGDDTLNGGDGDDVLIGGAGYNVFIGGAGNDTIGGGLPANIQDYLTYQTVDYRSATESITVVLSATSTVLGGPSVGIDTLGNIDRIIGTDGNDTFTVTKGFNSGTFGTFVEIEGAAGDDVINGRGDTAISYRLSPKGVDVDLGAGITRQDGYDGQDTVSGVCVVYGSAFDDLITGSDGNDFFRALAGNDTIDGGGGIDRADYRTSPKGVIVNLAEGIALQDGFDGTDTLLNIENLRGSESYSDLLIGDDGANELRGQGGNDTLNGGGNNDTLDGGAGNDVLNGGDGNDWASFALAVKAVTANLKTGKASGNDVGNDILISIENIAGGNGNDTLTGNDEANVIVGGDGNDTVDGAAGNDTLDGGAGKDSLKGGDGDDVFLVRGEEAATDSFDGGKGTDTIRNDSAADVAFSKFKPTNIEVFDNTGTDLLDHAILGTTGNDSLNFKGLTLLGVTRIDGLAGNDTLTGNDEANVIDGGDGKDTLDGAAGDDTLDGGAGKDSMTGGDGDDTFIVDDVGDKISEKKNGGTDTVEIIGFTAGKAFTLANNVEKLTIDDGVAISASGNGLDNLIVAGDGANTLNGAGGDDTLSGGNGNDVFVMAKSMGDDVITDFAVGEDLLDVQKLGYNLAQMLGALIQTPGGALFDFGNNGSVLLEGVDGTALDESAFVNLKSMPHPSDMWQGTQASEAKSGTAAADVLIGSDGADTLSGLEGKDTLVGGFGDDSLDGGTGADSLLGGAGNDTYVVDASGDKVVEVANGGTDTVKSSVSYTLAANVEDLILTGSGKINGTGNELNNEITGNGANNTLNGKDGDDTLSGGDGNDTLKGGNGEDVLIGGLGADRLTGGKDADIFVYTSLGDSGVKANKEPIDIITDFKSGEDHIDLSAIGGSGIHVVDSLTGSGGAEALFKGNLLSLDIDGDGSSDLDIQLNGVKSITDADFL